MISSAEEFVRLRTSSNVDEYLQAAQDDAPLDVWKEIIERYPGMRFWVAQNKMVPNLILEILSVDSDPSVRAMVASKRKLPENIQVQLAQDSNESVRRALAHNAKTARAVLQMLVDDSAPEVRRKVLERLDIPQEG